MTDNDETPNGLSLAGSMHLAELEIDIQQCERELREARMAFRQRKIDRGAYIRKLWKLEEALTRTRLYCMYAWERYVYQQEDADK